MPAPAVTNKLMPRAPQRPSDRQAVDSLVPPSLGGLLRSAAARLGPLFLILFVAGCAHYESRPISAERTAQDFQSRTLADAGLRAFIETNLAVTLPNWPLPVWDFTNLTLAAFYYHPDRDVARARWTVARAGKVTAAQRPNPTLSVTPGYNATTRIPTPWFVSPTLCLMLLQGTPERKHEAPLVRWLKGHYRAALPHFTRRPGAAIVVLVTTFVATAWIWHRLGEEFLPNFQERDFLMHWVEKPGTSLEAMTRITVRASRELRAIPGVRNFGSHIGRAEVADEVVGPNFTELWISIDPRAPYQPTIARIQEVVDGYPGLYRDLLTYLRERIKEVLTGASATIVVRIFGPELDVLRERAQAVGAALKEVPGVSELKVEPQTLVPQVQVRLRSEVAAIFGLAPAAVRRAVSTLIKGQKVGEVFEEQKIHDVTVWSVPAVRSDLGALREMLIELPGGGQVPLGDVADVIIVPTPNEIKREGASRRIDVTCNVSGRDLGSVAREIEAKVRSLSFPRGYHPELLGEYAARQEARRRLLILSALALAGILVLLLADFQSPRLVLLVALTLPFALIGGVLAAWFSGGVLSLGSLVGFVTVLGIAARNGIMLVSHYQHLEREEGEAFGPGLVMRGAEERLTPILMTASTAALALLPLVVRGNIPGHEIEFPMAVVILGGLVTSTLLNLLILPALFLRFGRSKRVG